MEREACVCDHGYERSDLCAEIIIIIIIIIRACDMYSYTIVPVYWYVCTKNVRGQRSAFELANKGMQLTPQVKPSRFFDLT